MINTEIAHHHCPYECENPQPFMAIRPGRTRAQRYCGRCYFRCGEWVRVYLCTPEKCQG